MSIGNWYDHIKWTFNHKEPLTISLEVQHAARMIEHRAGHTLKYAQSIQQDHIRPKHEQNVLWGKHWNTKCKRQHAVTLLHDNDTLGFLLKLEDSARKTKSKRPNVITPLHDNVH